MSATSGGGTRRCEALDRIACARIEATFVTWRRSSGRVAAASSLVSSNFVDLVRRDGRRGFDASPPAHHPQARLHSPRSRAEMHMEKVGAVVRREPVAVRRGCSTTCDVTVRGIRRAAAARRFASIDAPLEFRNHVERPDDAPRCRRRLRRAVPPGRRFHHNQIETARRCSAHDFANRANWNYPTAIRFGAGRIAELPDACKAAGIMQPLLVTDAGLAKLDITARGARHHAKGRADAGHLLRRAARIRSRPTSRAGVARLQGRRP